MVLMFGASLIFWAACTVFMVVVDFLASLDDYKKCETGLVIGFAAVFSALVALAGQVAWLGVYLILARDGYAWQTFLFMW